jgi:hypothetical protein
MIVRNPLASSCAALSGERASAPISTLDRANREQIRLPRSPLAPTTRIIAEGNQGTYE